MNGAGKGFIISLSNIHHSEKKRGGQKTITMSPRSGTLAKTGLGWAREDEAGIEKGSRADQ